MTNTALDGWTAAVNGRLSGLRSLAGAWPKSPAGAWPKSLARAWPIRWRILAIAALNTALALILLTLIWDGSQVLGRAWADLRHVRATERFLGELDRDAERLQSLIHRYISQPDPKVLERIGDLREMLISRFRVQARLDPFIAEPAEKLSVVTEMFVAGFDVLRDANQNISSIYEARISRPSREMAGLYAIIERLNPDSQSIIWPSLAKSRESYHAMMLAANAYYLSTSPAAALEVGRHAAAIRRTVPVMLDFANDDIQRQALVGLRDRAESFAQGVDALTAEFANQAKVLREAIDANADEMSASIERMTKSVQAVELSTQERFDRTLRDAAQKLGLVALAFVGLVALISLKVSRSISEPLRELGGSMQAIAGGVYDRGVQGIGARDEIGDMARTVEVFRQNAIDKHRAEGALRESRDGAEKALAELRETQASLIEAEKFAALGGLVAGVAHEVNNPVGISLTVASSLAHRCETIAVEVRDGTLRRSRLVEFIEDVRDAANQLCANLHRAGDLVQSFKQVAVDRSQDERRSFDLRQTCEQICASLRPGLKTPLVAFVFEGPEGIRMDGYPGPLGQVLTNLFLNAVRHGFAGDRSGTIRLRIESAPGDRAVITFSDDGAGMSEEVKRRAFDPFFTTRRESGGTGLGLHLAYNIVTRQLGGRISLVSAPGEGSQFVITLPLAAPHKSDTPESVAA